MRILILGGDGMLGHQLLRHFKGHHDVRVTLRLGYEAYERHRLFEHQTAYCGIDARHTDGLLQVIADFRPEAVVNVIGIVKQRSEAKDVIPSLEINSLLPHRLALVCRTVEARLVHLSTDCVCSLAEKATTAKRISRMEKTSMDEQSF